MAERKNPELDAKHQAILRKMMQLPENKTCADCRGPSPRWASTNLGVFVCISCSGIHRKLGTHISQVRSVTLDTWTPGQVAHFTKFGNARAAQYFEACLPPDFRRPQSGDSLQIERFIRDKYENKRYITIENGGLGGQASGSAYRSGLQSSGVGGLGSRPPQLSDSLSRQTGGYDASSGVYRTATSSISYGGRFGSGPRSSAASTSSISYTAGNGMFSASGTSTGGGLRPRNAMQRANTLKELLNMGFSSDIAARAVAAAEGDLQRAVDWVLQNNDQTAHPPLSMSVPPKPRAVEKNLLDFGDPVPDPAKVAKPAPKAVSSEALITRKAQNNPSPSPAQDGFADFADFGAFESALPTTKPSPSAVGTSATSAISGSLSASLASLYKQSPPKPPLSGGVGVPHIPHLGSNSPSLSPTSQPRRNVPSPKLMAQKAADAAVKIPKADLGLTTFTELAGHNIHLPAKEARLNNVTAASATGARYGDQGSAAPPPPPPPMQEPALFGSKEAPPPPTPPPPFTPAPPEEPHKLQAHAVNGLAGTDGKENGGSPVAVDSQADQDILQEQQKQIPEEEEEEDPFAALSMMALSSAKSSKKTAKADKRETPPRPQVAVKATPPSTGTANGGINLDDLLG